MVIGAGLAGLTAALDLREAGWDVVVLEARDRVGGRVHTIRQPFSDGLHAEGGGESIDDSHTAIQALVSRFGLATERRPADKIDTAQIFANGRRQPVSEFITAGNGRALADYTRFGDELAKLGAGMDPAHPEAFARAEELDATTLAAFVDRLDLAPEARLLVEIENRGEFNAELHEVSLLFAAQQSATLTSVTDSGTEIMRITGGNSRLAEAMRAELGAAVVLATPVSRVEWASDHVRVVSASRTVDAARLVVALPTPPLRRIAFAPSLPAALAQAITDVSLGAAAKVATQYRHRFWNDLHSAGFTLTDLPFHIGWAATDSYGSPTDPGILSQFITGDAARAAAKMTDRERITSFESQLDEVYPEGVGLRDGRAATIAWSDEPFTGGGYTVFGPRQLLTAWPAMRAGVGPIRFAGEHTEALAGYMDSAVRSGHRVAKEFRRAPS